MASVHKIIPEPWIFKDKKMAEIDQTEARLNTHEEVCALRYEGICARLKRLENIGVAVAGAIILMLLSILVKMN
jgi:hypothetical protein